MFASPRTLIIPLDGDELAVTVDGDDALLDLGPAGRARDPGPDEPTEPDEPDEPDEPGELGDEPDGPVAAGRAVLRLRVPARALVAALRVAWADEHDRGRFEPWRGQGSPAGGSYSGGSYSGGSYSGGSYSGGSYARPAYGRLSPARSPYDRHDYGYDAEYDRWDDAFEDGYARYGHADRPYDDDLGDGDPAGFRDPTVVPFPYRPPPTPARSGALWEPHEHRTLREMWFAATPDADKNELVRDIATRLERGVGGVAARLRVAGCDPTRPGSPWDGSWASDDREPASGPETGPEAEPVSLDGSG